ncbi:CYTH domain-containing protein [Lachnospiraceae bacterium MD1]|jgi:CYTH domain-containing protein|uniref:CYTH domain-containing protein n=1 Tax=Variimorphobacter saccharofermentans TaxID=2755051 RepID=A0A839K065_9FIRM|nr:CYTH domain-containing protein [Variimorphobacter saccharofermentans]MBB2182309.1 CYTH domain-containing protein [Variimorphobacter saccharofermentans]
MEIERKYEIHKLPEKLSQYSYKNIEQGYLCHKPTIRIRKSNDQYILTYKSKILQKDQDASDNPVINDEVELPLTEEAYLNLKKKIDGNMVYKTRYLIPLQDHLTAELDVFREQLSGLMMVEVEFPDVEASKKFVPPDWFGKDVSGDNRFTNYYLSTITDYKALLTE